MSIIVDSDLANNITYFIDDNTTNKIKKYIDYRKIKNSNFDDIKIYSYYIKWIKYIFL
jgi:hypothetical protein